MTSLLCHRLSAINLREHRDTENFLLLAVKEKKMIIFIKLFMSHLLLLKSSSSFIFRKEEIKTIDDFTKGCPPRHK